MISPRFVYESGYRRIRMRGGVMSIFGGNACNARISLSQWSLYSILSEYRPFLRTHNNAGSILDPQALHPKAKPLENQSKSVGQGRWFEPLLQLPRRLSPSSDNIFALDKILNPFPYVYLEGWPLRISLGLLRFEFCRIQEFTPLIRILR